MEQLNRKEANDTGLDNNIKNENKKKWTRIESSKVLVTYFSETGNTQKLAKLISDEVGGDFRKIETVKSYPVKNISFIITSSLSLIFGILSSEDILSFLNIRNLQIIKFHKMISYISLVLVGLHLGINLNIMIIKIQRLIKNRVLLNLIRVPIIMYGVYSFCKHDIIKHITGYYEFAFSDCIFIVNFIRYTSIILASSLITNYI